MFQKVLTQIKNLGPGLLFAGAAIGVSHLVQSTRAGADFGFGLLWALLLINIIKYPFFQYGPRYATATGESLIDGYKKLGHWVLIIYFLLTFMTMFTIQAAVTIVTAGLAHNLFGISANLTIWSAVITLLCLAILLLGKYKILDRSMKVIVSILAFSSVIAVGIALSNNQQSFSMLPQLPKGTTELAFLIAFLGWMPAPLDVSTWHSLWTLEKNKAANNTLDVKTGLKDFNIGFATTVFLGICFMSLGALMMYHSPEKIQSGASAFAQQLINLYTTNLGKGAAVFIGVAALTTMFSTTLTTLDASPRAMAKSSELLFGQKNKLTYLTWILLLTFGTLIILSFFKTSMITFVKIATILSFLTAPFYAIANFILVKGKHMPIAARPSTFLSALSYFGIVFLIFFGIWYLSSL